MQQRRYLPYQKWLGTAFAELTHDDDLSRHLAAAACGDQNALGEAYRAVAGRHNASNLTAPLHASLGNYHDRPARVVMADRFSDALQETVTDPFLTGLPRIGSIDQVIDSVDVLDDPALFRRLTTLYGRDL